MEKENLLSKNLILLIKQKGISQAETGRGLGFSPSKLNNYISGHSKPSLDDLFKLLEYFGVTASQILETDLSAGNLIHENSSSNLNKSSKLTGNITSNLMEAKAPYKLSPGKHKNDPSVPFNVNETTIIINELNKIYGHLETLVAIMSKKAKGQRKG